MKKIFTAAALALLAGGCASYTWKSSVPDDKRTVTVTVFRNSSAVTELGNLCTRELGRELQREGTFRLSREGALELQGEVVSSGGGSLQYGERSYGQRYTNGRLQATVKVSLIDKREGKVLWNDRTFSGETGLLHGGRDSVSIERDASGRLAEDIARQIVDELAAWDFSDKTKAAEAAAGEEQK